MNYFVISLDWGGGGQCQHYSLTVKLYCHDTFAYFRKVHIQQMNHSNLPLEGLLLEVVYAEDDDEQNVEDNPQDGAESWSKSIILSSMKLRNRKIIIKWFDTGPTNLTCDNDVVRNFNLLSKI
jgi:hypothetical protein